MNNVSMFTVTDDCIRCGLCGKLCPARIIRFDDMGIPHVRQEDESRCIRCGQCVSFCPKSCCYLDYQEERIPVDPASMPDASTAELFLRSRRSVRAYKPEPVPEETVRRIIETARYAPSATNSQPVRWVISPTAEKTREIGNLMADYFRAETEQNIPYANLYGALASAWDAGKDVFFRTAPNLAIAIVNRSHPFSEDAAIALTYFELAAYANGIGCCWGGFLTIAARNSAAVQQAIGAKPDEFIVGAQMFGTPTISQPRLLPPRKHPDISWL